MKANSRNYSYQYTDPGQKPEPSWKFWKQRRYMLAFLVFWGYFNLYSLRVNMSIAIVAMTQDKSDTLENGTKIKTGPEFKWDNKIQGYVLSSFFYGFFLTQLLGGILSQRFGGKFIYGCGICSTAVITLVCPWLAKLGPFCLMVGRILMGSLEGLTYASLYTIWAKWLPPLERSRVTSQTHSGCYLGTIFGMMFYSYLDQIAGWRSIFWFSGGLGVLWFLAWFYLTAESPETDSKISPLELQYIQQSLQEFHPTKRSPVQWKSILTSIPVWAYSLALFCETWGFFTLLTLLPKYFRDVYKFDLSKCGGLSALPYVAIAIMMQITGHLSDWVAGKKWLTITQIRKLFIGIGFLSQCGFLIGAAYCSVITGTVFCLVMALGMGAFALSILIVNSLDIAPCNSSVITGLGLSIGVIPGIGSPITAGYIISTENPTVEQWRMVFYIAAGLYLFGAIFYIIFGSGLRQPWDLECDSPSSDNVSSKEIIN